jgi:hypothetical protein
MVLGHGQRGRQRFDRPVPAGRAIGGEVRGEGKLQGLTVVRLHHVSRVAAARKGDLDGSPKWRQRGPR